MKPLLGGRPEHQYRVQEWFLSFRRSTPLRMVAWLTTGQRFRHVCCFGFLPVVGAWLFHDWNAGATCIWVVPDGEADPMLARAQRDAVVVRFVPPLVVGDSRLKPGFWCVTSVAHLTGVRSGALRPDALFRDCLAQGGTIVTGSEAYGCAEDEAGSGDCAPAGAGAR